MANTASKHCNYLMENQILYQAEKQFLMETLSKMYSRLCLIGANCTYTFVFPETKCAKVYKNRNSVERK